MNKLTIRIPEFDKLFDLEHYFTLRNRNKREYMKRWRKKHLKEHNVKQFSYYIKYKQEIFNLLGNKCARCGFNDKRALQIDHINGGGCKEREQLFGSKYTSGSIYYKRILDKIKDGSKEYQLLCANCNWIKRHERGENN